MLEIRRLQEQALSAVTQARALMDAAERAGRAMSAEEDQAFNGFHAEAERLVALRERLERQEDLERRQIQATERDRIARERQMRENRVNPDDEAAAAAHTRAFDRWMRRGIHGLNTDERGIMERRLRALSPEEQAILGAELRDIGTDASGTPFGGYTIPQDFMRRLEVALVQWNGIFGSPAEQIRTSTGAPMPWPTTDDSGVVGELLGEGSATVADDTANIVFGRVVFGAYTYSSKAILVQRQLLQDSAFDLPGLIAQLAGERLGRITGTHCTTGTGTAQPKGIVTCAVDSTITFPIGTPTDWNSLNDLAGSVNAAYRQSPGFGYMMSDAGFIRLRKVKDTTGQPIWSLGGVNAGMSGAAPPTLAGYPYYIVNQMAAPTGTNKAYLAGDFSRYKIRRVLDATMLRLEERYAEFLQVGFILFLRLDANLVAANAVKFSIMAA